MDIKQINTGDIKPYEKNAKSHPKKQIEKIANSIKEFGFAQPIVVDKEMVIIVGHGRYEAAKLLKMAKVPVLQLDLSDEQARAYRLADNKLNESDWDMNLVIAELKGLTPPMIDLSGFSLDLTLEPEDKDDEVPEAPKVAQSKLGDIYQLGNHRILCGDSTSIDDVATLMQEKEAEILFTSPPYSDMRDYNGEKDLSVEKLAQFIQVFHPFCKYQIVNLGIQRKEGEIYEYWNEYIKIARSAGYKLLSWNIWEQDGAGSIGKQRAFFPIEHEWIFVFGKEFKDINRTEIRDSKKKNTRSSHRNKDGSVEKHNVGRQEALKEMGTVLYVPAEKSEIRKDHPAIFPVELAEKYIVVMTEPKNIVVEPFLGSGSVLIACEKTDRICYGMELDPKYVDVVVSRYVEYTGINKVIKNNKEIQWKNK